ncbi:uncharacterized protein DUF1302 [Azomonas agilis]|uniref:Uncharacterized protein DUF1302 n=1 Tax=Azomonas agilis TaxID=116849 RepID=A0A562J1X5_9GAMM|nr:DUF1302 family protein [Azomonas agilis]TWH77259.1 uncharacterized protein DUF1302 [Azomonas agilis]
MRFLCVLICLGVVPSALAISFNLGALEAQLDSRFSLDLRWAAEEADSAWIGASNGGQGQSPSSDDGRLNFRRGDSFSRRAEGQHDLELRLGDSGVFVQGRYWYDFALQNHSQSFRELDNGHRPRAAQSAGSQWLQAFVFHHYQLAGQPGTLRWGRQVVDWGEGQLLPSALDVINPVDFNRFSGLERPDTEDRVPVNLLYLSQSLPQRWTLDAFYQWGDAMEVPANCGGFFAQRDVSTRGCSYYAVDRDVNPWAQAEALGLGYAWSSEGVLIPRAGDQKAQHSGQFGLALFWQGDHVRLGFHWLRYHSRQGMLGVRTANAEVLAYLAQNTETSAVNEAVRLGHGRYFFSYPEAIRLYGLSATGTLASGGTLWGVLTYQPNTPLQRNQAQLIDWLGQTSEVAEQEGYQRKRVAQGQLGIHQPLNAEIAGAQQLSVEAELGYVRVMGLGSERYGRDPVFGSAGREGFITSEAWGYRLRLSADYATPIARLYAQPQITFTQDVQGYAPNEQFSQGACSIAAKLGFSYMDTYAVEVSYSHFYGGQYNSLKDRDFMRIKFSTQF